MTRSWLIRAGIGVAGAAAVGVVGTSLAFAAPDSGPTPRPSAPVNPSTPVNKATLPANINPHKNPWEKKLPGYAPKAAAALSRQRVRDSVKQFQAEHPGDGVICYKPDGTVGDGVLVDRVNPNVPLTAAQKKLICANEAATRGIQGLHP